MSHVCFVRTCSVIRALRHNQFANCIPRSRDQSFAHFQLLFWRLRKGDKTATLTGKIPEPENCHWPDGLAGRFCNRVCSPPTRGHAAQGGITLGPEQDDSSWHCSDARSIWCQTAIHHITRCLPMVRNSPFPPYFRFATQ
jgi:hypothetical protein